MEFILRLIVSALLAAFDALVFYVAFDTFGGYKITWPIVFAVAWVTQSVISHELKTEL